MVSTTVTFLWTDFLASKLRKEQKYIYRCFQFWVEYEKQYTFGPIKTYNIWIN